MKQQIQMSVLFVMVILGVLNPATAALNSTNKIPVPLIIQATKETENLWAQSHKGYLCKARNDAKHFNTIGINLEEYPVFFSSFTNMIQKPFPSPAENQAHSLLRLRSLCIIEYLRNDEVRSDKRAWIVMAKHIGEIRSQIIPDYTPQANPMQEPYMMSPSKKRDQAIKEYERKRAEDQYQYSLKKENRSLSLRFIIYVENLPIRDEGEKLFFQQLTNLANLTEEERAKLKK